MPHSTAGHSSSRRPPPIITHGSSDAAFAKEVSAFLQEQASHSRAPTLAELGSSLALQWRTVSKSAAHASNSKPVSLKQWLNAHAEVGGWKLWSPRHGELRIQLTGSEHGGVGGADYTAARGAATPAASMRSLSAASSAAPGGATPRSTTARRKEAEAGDAAAAPRVLQRDQLPTGLSGVELAALDDLARLLEGSGAQSMYLSQLGSLVAWKAKGYDAELGQMSQFMRRFPTVIEVNAKDPGTAFAKLLVPMVDSPHDLTHLRVHGIGSGLRERLRQALHSLAHGRAPPEQLIESLALGVEEIRTVRALPEREKRAANSLLRVLGKARGLGRAQDELHLADAGSSAEEHSPEVQVECGPDGLASLANVADAVGWPSKFQQRLGDLPEFLARFSQWFSVTDSGAVRVGLTAAGRDAALAVLLIDVAPRLDSVREWAIMESAGSARSPSALGSATAAADSDAERTPGSMLAPLRSTELVFRGLDEPGEAEDDQPVYGTAINPDGTRHLMALPPVLLHGVCAIVANCILAEENAWLETLAGATGDAAMCERVLACGPGPAPAHSKSPSGLLDMVAAAAPQDVLNSRPVGATPRPLWLHLLTGELHCPRLQPASRLAANGSCGSTTGEELSAPGPSSAVLLCADLLAHLAGAGFVALGIADVARALRWDDHIVDAAGPLQDFAARRPALFHVRPSTRSTGLTLSVSDTAKSVLKTAAVRVAILRAVVLRATFPERGASSSIALCSGEAASAPAVRRSSLVAQRQVLAGTVLARHLLYDASKCDELSEREQRCTMTTAMVLKSHTAAALIRCEDFLAARDQLGASAWWTLLSTPIPGRDAAWLWNTAVPDAGSPAQVAQRRIVLAVMRALGGEHTGAGTAAPDTAQLTWAAVANALADAEPDVAAAMRVLHACDAWGRIHTDDGQLYASAYAVDYNMLSPLHVPARDQSGRVVCAPGEQANPSSNFPPALQSPAQPTMQQLQQLLRQYAWLFSLDGTHVRAAWLQDQPAAVVKLLAEFAAGCAADLLLSADITARLLRTGAGQFRAAEVAAVCTPAVSSVLGTAANAVVAALGKNHVLRSLPPGYVLGSSPVPLKTLAEALAWNSLFSKHCGRIKAFLTAALALPSSQAPDMSASARASGFHATFIRFNSPQIGHLADEQGLAELEKAEAATTAVLLLVRQPVLDAALSCADVPTDVMEQWDLLDITSLQAICALHGLEQSAVCAAASVDTSAVGGKSAADLPKWSRDTMALSMSELRRFRSRRSAAEITPAPNRPSQSTASLGSVSSGSHLAQQVNATALPVLSSAGLASSGAVDMFEGFTDVPEYHPPHHLQAPPAMAHGELHMPVQGMPPMMPTMHSGPPMMHAPMPGMPMANAGMEPHSMAPHFQATGQLQSPPLPGMEQPGLHADMPFGMPDAGTEWWGHKDFGSASQPLDLGLHSGMSPPVSHMSSSFLTALEPLQVGAPASLPLDNESHAFMFSSHVSSPPTHLSGLPSPLDDFWDQLHTDTTAPATTVNTLRMWGHWHGQQ